MRQFFSLRLQMAGDAEIDPILELEGQMKDFEGHGSIPLQFPEPSLS